MQAATFHHPLIVADPHPSAGRRARFVRPDQLHRQARVTAVEPEAGR